MKNEYDEDIKFAKQVGYGAVTVIIITVVAFIILLFIVVGFTRDRSNTGSYAKASEGDMLVIIENDYYYCIVYDKETMVEYVISNGSVNNDVIITPLINPDGTPKLYKEE